MKLFRYVIPPNRSSKIKVMLSTLLKYVSLPSILNFNSEILSMQYLFFPRLAVKT